MIPPKISTYGLKVTEGGRGLALTILKIKRCTHRWHLVLADARWLECDGNVSEPKARIAITSVFFIISGLPLPVIDTSSHSLIVSASDPSHH